MTQRLIIRPQAQTDLEEAAEWYEARRAGLGGEFLREIGFVLEEVRQHPLRFPQVYKDARRARLDRFPYGIYFLAGDDAVEVVAVMHAKRSPWQWQRRV
jgi:plasmid stabilization system protein ParE